MVKIARLDESNFAGFGAHLGRDILRIVHGGEATEHTAGVAKRQAGRKGRAGRSVS
jgi:hypothetical protein